jgi:hypothetical protein
MTDAQLSALAEAPLNNAKHRITAFRDLRKLFLFWKIPPADWPAFRQVRRLCRGGHTPSISTQ